MSKWLSSKAKKVNKALLKIGWSPKSSTGTSHIRLRRIGLPDYTWAFHDSVEIGPVMLSKISKQTGLTPQDL